MGVQSSGKAVFGLALRPRFRTPPTWSAEGILALANIPILDSSSRVMGFPLGDPIGDPLGGPMGGPMGGLLLHLLSASSLPLWALASSLTILRENTTPSSVVLKTPCRSSSANMSSISRLLSPNIRARSYSFGAVLFMVKWPRGSPSCIRQSISIQSDRASREHILRRGSLSQSAG